MVQNYSNKHTISRDVKNYVGKYLHAFDVDKGTRIVTSLIKKNIMNIIMEAFFKAI